ncbi:hypothetical protein GCM10009654_06440 [Streptomyces hebeiensis]|uniref:Uncharacterized protein n=1 Tax=Streptomyces hebeiensis TaxID=229486 RepID=A0ABN1UIZ5_9ACTN
MSWENGRSERQRQKRGKEGKEGKEGNEGDEGNRLGENLWGETACSVPYEVRGLEALNREGIMNYAMLTALLPKLTGFTSPRGPHSSTVQQNLSK